MDKSDQIYEKEKHSYEKRNTNKKDNKKPTCTEKKENKKYFKFIWIPIHVNLKNVLCSMQK